MGRSRPPLPSGAAAAPHLVELPLARLDQERPRPPARPYVGDRGCREAGSGASRARAVPGLDAAVRPCAADHRVRGVNQGREVARAIDALRRGWPVAVNGLGLLAIETADEVALAALDAARPADLLISGNRAAT